MRCFCTRPSGKLGCTLWITAGILYFVPLLYGILFFIGAGFDWKTQAFVLACVSFGTINVLTSIIGYIGLCLKIPTAIQATGTILIFENAITFLVAMLFLVDISQIRPEASAHGASRTLRYLANHREVGLPFCTLLFACTIVSCAFHSTLAELQNELDSEYYAFEYKTTKAPGEHQNLLLSNKRGDSCTNAQLPVERVANPV